MGNVKAALLLTCPFKSDKSNNVQQIEFLRPTYKKVNRPSLNQIDIEIKDEDVDLIPFLQRKILITFHFRKRND